MTQPVDHSNDCLVLPLLDQEIITVFRRQFMSTSGHPALEPPEGRSVVRGPDPAMTQNAQTRGSMLVKLDLVHQTVNCTQAVAQPPGGGISVRDSQVEV